MTPEQKKLSPSDFITVMIKTINEKFGPGEPGRFSTEEVEWLMQEYAKQPTPSPDVEAMAKKTADWFSEDGKDHNDDPLYSYWKLISCFKAGFQASQPQDAAQVQDHGSKVDLHKLRAKFDSLFENETIESFNEWLCSQLSAKDEEIKRLGEPWISVEDRPLFVRCENKWMATEDGSKEFIAALSYFDRRTQQNHWWIKHCVIEEEVGLCIVGDDENEPAGWHMSGITHWMPLPEPPKTKEGSHDI